MPPSSDTVDIVIAGGSYAGLTLAIALSRHSGGDLQIAVVSPKLPALETATPPADIRASALARGSLNLLAAIGVWPDLAPNVQIINSIELTDSALTDALRPTVLTYDFAATPPAPSTLPIMVMVENHRLGAALHRAARDSPGVTLLVGASIADFTTGTESVCATLQTGNAISAKLLVAADGSRSHLRTKAGIKTTGWPYAQSGIVTIVTPAMPHGGRAIQHFLPSGPFAILPMTRNRICVTWTEATAEAARILALDSAGFRAEIERRFGSRFGPLETIAPPQSWPLEMNVARRMIAPRFALIGDAAHTLHPIAGQGLNLGLRDVAALTETLLEAAGLGLDIGNTTTLENYERRRRFDNLASAAAFDTFNRLFSRQSTFARSARGAALGIADALPVLKSWLITEASGDLDAAPALLRNPTSG